MTTSVNIDAIMNQPGRVRALRRVVETVADGLGTLVDLYRRPYVDGLQNLPRDGRFLLVGNHTQFGAEVFLIRTWCGARSAPGCGPWPIGESAVCAARLAICSPPTALSSGRRRPPAS